MSDLEKAESILREYKQEHIIKLIEKLDEEKKNELVGQILKIDFNQIHELYENTKKQIEFKEKKIEPISYLDKAKLSEEQTKKFNDIGREIIEKGEYAVVTMAGGQGTRLGHTGPKGTFKLDVYGKGKYLFEILTENLKEANKLYKTTIPWYIMTSKENNDVTKEFLEKNNYFGYDKNYVTLFAQGELPLVNTEGKLLIGKDMKIKEASDGNGGVFASLASTGAIADMKQRNIKWIFIGGVDNAILKMADITLLGMAEQNKVQIASKSVVKANPHEKVGVFCKCNGTPKVIEYSELPEKMAEEVDNNGELKYGESHIMCNLFTIDAIEKVSKETLMYHSAFKKNSYIDENGKEIVPEEPNSYKFEAFIFDAFEFFDDIAILRGKREDDFAPVKNKEGVDSPKTAKELYEKYWERQKNK
ncbi:MAG: UTP--glucose-1-phosphate uridylyltransferase [Clostridia bacterium]|nr:UTP--glucose-1-phosphate uridylyltransferase [Clostridia bacterium]